MKRWIARLAVASALAGGMLAVIAGPAQAGQWVNGGIWEYKFVCENVGKARVNSGQYETYVCEPWGLLWRLRGYVD